MNHARLPDMHYPRFMVIAHAHYLLKPWQEVVWSNDICCLDPRLNRVNPPRHAPPSLARNDRAHTPRPAHTPGSYNDPGPFA